ncbi:hypothetical protein N7492_008861 [Penicillium capsulatum]|uniref:Uncharacterized protein n=1 Tax=Penicillium capsulatum TaxID=69766 RepID=A0A9W9LHC3_9EURO|nr:hypothetical protein N7492_008861 [Penicillium capsulatum]KAJ6106263.1 hypothetical protein N7512_009780 [Penicillium capsulatum]
MARLSSSQLERPVEHASKKSPNAQSTTDIAKKKKKSRKSKNKEPSSLAPATNGNEIIAPQDEEARPPKRKRDSEHRSKKSKKSKHVEESNHDELSGKNAERDEEGQHEVDGNREGGLKDVATPQESPESPAPEPDLPRTKSGKVKKIRGPRDGGKNNQKIGFFLEEEVRKLEAYKVHFCNTHGFAGNMGQFDTMVQHSERSGEPFPCPADICTKTNFWADIYALLPGRDRRSVYRFMRRHFQQSAQKAHDWTEEQDKEFIRLLEIYGPKWTQIAKLLGRSDDDVTQRWKNRLEHRDKMNRGAWTEQELRGLMNAVDSVWQLRKLECPGLAGDEVFAMDDKLVAWGSVSDSMNNSRSRQQCADKWRKIRKHIYDLRATTDPNAEFDPVELAKRSYRWSEKTLTPKSQKMVRDDDDEDIVAESAGNVQQSAKKGFADFMKMLESQTENSTPESASQPEPSSQPQPKSTDSNEIHETPKARKPKISSSSKKRKHSDVETPADDAKSPTPVETPTRKPGKSEKRRRKRERRARERQEREEAEAATARQANEAEEAEAKKRRKKEKRREKRRKSAAEADEKAAVTTPSSQKSMSKKHTEATEPNGTPADVSSRSKKKSKSRKSAGNASLNGGTSDHAIKMEGNGSD